MLTERFTFLCNSNERRLLAAISKRLKRSQGDTIRQLISAAAFELNLEKQILENGDLQLRITAGEDLPADD